MLGVKILKNLVPAFEKLTNRQINVVVAIVMCEQHSGRVKKEAASFPKGKWEEKVIFELTLEGRVRRMVGKKKKEVQRTGEKFMCLENRD